MISSAYVTSFVQENGESDDSDSTEEDSRENITQTYEQIEAVDNEYEDSADTRTLLKGLQMNLTWNQLIRKLPRKNEKLFPLLSKNMQNRTFFPY